LKPAHDLQQQTTDRIVKNEMKKILRKQKNVQQFFFLHLIAFFFFFLHLSLQEEENTVCLGSTIELHDFFMLPIYIFDPNYNATKQNIVYEKRHFRQRENK
jgi:hypothetical protein